MKLPTNYVISGKMRYSKFAYFWKGHLLLVIHHLVLHWKNKDDLQLKSNKGCFSAINNAFFLRLWDHVWQYRRHLNLGSTFNFWGQADPTLITVSLLKREISYESVQMPIHPFSLGARSIYVSIYPSLLSPKRIFSPIHLSIHSHHAISGA